MMESNYLSFCPYKTYLMELQSFEQAQHLENSSLKYYRALLKQNIELPPEN